MKKTVIELFAGVGGFRVGLNKISSFGENGLALEQGNWDFVWANQWEPSTKSQPAFDCYVTRFGDTEQHVNEDITNIDKNIIPEHTLLVGGFPCQDYSVARGLSGEKGIQGKKGVLWWQIYEILETKHPPFILLENVDRLLKSPSKQRGRDFGIMLRGLSDLGYAVEWRVINAADYSMPQRRRRVFIFAFHKDTKYYKNISKLSHKEIIYNKGLFSSVFKIESDFLSHLKDTEIDMNSYKDIFDVSDNFSSQLRNTGIFINNSGLSIETKSCTTENAPLQSILEDDVHKDLYLNDDKINKLRYLKSAKRIERKRPNGDSYFYTEGNMAFPDSLDLPGRTMLTSESSINRSTHVIKDKTNGLRIISPVEAERLNTFPDNWTNTGMTNKQRYFMMGNALVCSIISKLGNQLELIIEKE